MCCRWCRIAVEHACFCCLSVSNYTARFDSRGLVLTRPLRRLLARTKSRRHPRLSSQSFKSVAGPVGPVVVIVPRCRRRKGLRVACVAACQPSVRHFSRTDVNVEESRRSFYVMSFLPPHGTFCNSQSRRRHLDHDQLCSSMLRECRRLPICAVFMARSWHQRSELTKNDGDADERALSHE